MKYFILALFVSIQFSLVGQGSSQLYNINQICNTESTFLSHVGKPKLDSKLVILFEPNACPRCESSFKVLNEYLDSKNMEYEYLLCGAVMNSNLKSKYNYLNSKLSTISNNDISKLFYLGNDLSRIQVPFILKIDAQGKLIYQKSMLGITLNRAFVDSIQDDDDLVCTDSKTVTSGLVKNVDCRMILCKNIFNGDLFDGNSYSNFYHVSKSKYAVIEINNGFIQKVDINNDSILNITVASPAETHFFNKGIPENIMNRLLDYNILKTIYLKIIDANEMTFKVIASLPHVVKEEDGYGYFNEPVLVEKNWNGDIINIELIDVEIGEDYVLKHAKSFFNHDSLACFKVVKGWPAVGTKNEFDKKESKNLNSDLFYKDAFEYRCKCGDDNVFDLGSLTQFHIDNKLGYYLDYTNMHFIKDTLVYWNGLDGNITFYKLPKEKTEPKLIKRIKIFDNNLPDQNVFKDITIAQIKDLKLREDCIPNFIKALAFHSEDKVIAAIVKKDNRFWLQVNHMPDGQQLWEMNIDILSLDYIFQFDFIAADVEDKLSVSKLNIIYESKGKVYVVDFALGLD